jgi:cellulose synthase/poly-beta-1,6-N-acetylglucosamine synthase-like glycosyltransferase
MDEPGCSGSVQNAAAQPDEGAPAGSFHAFRKPADCCQESPPPRAANPEEAEPMIFAGLIVLVLSAAGLLYPWVVYPLWLRRRCRRWSLITMARDHEVSVSIIIPAFNRQSVILRKLRNTLALDYPAELVEVLVVADGCTDRTEDLVRRVRDPRVRLVSLPRGGRLSSLQQAVLRARGEILVFTDANVTVRRGSLRRLIRNFADWHVGGACAAVRTRHRRDGDALGPGEAAFARLEANVRQLEGQLGSVHAAESALFAIRRGLFNAPRNLAQADDMAISMRVVLAGKRLVYEPTAICFRDVQPDGAREMQRRRYAVNYAIRSVRDVRWKLLRRPGYGLQVWSHTIARFLTPVWGLLGTAAAVSLTLADPAFAPLLTPPVLLLLMAGTGWALRNTRLGRIPLLAMPAWFAAFTRAMLFGSTTALAGYRPLGAKPRSQAAMRGAARAAPADLADIPDDDLLLNVRPSPATNRASGQDSTAAEAVDPQADVPAGFDILQALT